MNINEINAMLGVGKVDPLLLFPHLESLKEVPYIFKVDFGLTVLPKEPGILLIRGARQYGKSTWLEQQVIEIVKQCGPGSAYYLNGDNIADADSLEESISNLATSYSKNIKLGYLFIDEITAIEKWEIVLKRMADRGLLNKMLIVTTGSRATDLRRGAERLPGRKGKLARTTYLFTPISYTEFKRQCGKKIGKNTLLTYLLSGGSPIACNELASTGIIPEYVIQLVRDWVEGEITRTGRTRSALINVLSVLFRFGGTPVGQAKLAREAGLANNTVAAGYIELLRDLGCVTPSYPWDKDRNQLILRKECKYHFVNLLVAVAYHPANIRRIDDFLKLPETEQAIWYEWLVAQEISRINAINNKPILEPLAFWQNQQHEIDFVLAKDKLLEIKRGKSFPLEFAWFRKIFPKQKLTVINSQVFASENIFGITMEDFLLEKKS